MDAIALCLLAVNALMPKSKALILNLPSTNTAESLFAPLLHCSPAKPTKRNKKAIIAQQEAHESIQDCRIRANSTRKRKDLASLRFGNQNPPALW